jgi:hypothetical protein
MSSWYVIPQLKESPFVLGLVALAISLSSGHPTLFREESAAIKTSKDGSLQVGKKT